MIGMNSYIYINHLKVYCWVIIHWWIYHNLFLSIHPLKDILVASSFWLLQLKMVWTFMSIWAVVVFFFFLDKYLGMEWLHYMVGCMFNYFLKFILIGGLLQYCGGFCHTWISYGCTCVPHPVSPSHLSPYPIPQGHPSALALSALSHASYLDWQSISHMVS